MDIKVFVAGVDIDGHHHTILRYGNLFAAARGRFARNPSMTPVPFGAGETVKDSEFGRVKWFNSFAEAREELLRWINNEFFVWKLNHYPNPE